jgi:hypothetical protein
MLACHVSALRSTRSSCNSNPSAALAGGAAAPHCRQAVASSRAPSLQCHGSQRNNANSILIDAKGLSYLGDSIWTVSGSLRAVRIAVTMVKQASTTHALLMVFSETQDTLETQQQVHYLPSTTGPQHSVLKDVVMLLCARGAVACLQRHVSRGYT